MLKVRKRHVLSLWSLSWRPVVLDQPRLFTIWPQGDTPTQCGSARWPVKTLTDPKAGQVNLAPKPATVEELAVLPDLSCYCFPDPRSTAFGTQGTWYVAAASEQPPSNSDPAAHLGAFRGRKS